MAGPDGSTSLRLGSPASGRDTSCPGLTLRLIVPLMIDPASTANLVVALDGSSSGVRATSLSAPPSPSIQLARLGWLGLLVLALGLVLVGRGCRRTVWLSLGVVVMLCWSLLLTGCPEDDSKTLTFTAALPANGVSAQGAVSGPLTGPSAQLVGPRVMVSSDQ